MIYNNENEQFTTTNNNINEFHKHSIDWKKPDTGVCTIWLIPLIYTTKTHLTNLCFSKWKSWLPFWRDCSLRDWKGVWGWLLGKVQFHNLGTGYIGAQFVKIWAIYLWYMYFSIWVLYSNKKLKTNIFTNHDNYN